MWRVLLSPVMICCVLCSARRVAAGQLSRDLLTARPAPAATETTTETEERGQHRDIPGQKEAYLEHYSGFNEEANFANILNK